MSSFIRLSQCRQHNLKGFDVEIPHGALTVISGVSGSGKSSLAFDTLFAEGQRRYVETFSAYARQFLDRMERPRVAHVEGIPPAVAIEQGNRVRSSRSSVATVTEIHDYLKVLFARLGTRHCSRCGRPVAKLSPAEIVAECMAGGSGELLVGFEVEAHEPDASCAALIGAGVRRVFESGRVLKLDQTSPPPVGTWVAILDRIELVERRRGRLLDAIEQAFAHGRGHLVLIDSGGEMRRYGRELKCLDCDLTYAPIEPAELSFNDPLGACETCHGFGRVIEIDPDLVVPDPSKPVGRGAIRPLSTPKTRWERRQLRAFLERRGIDPRTPYAALEEDQRKLLWEGEEGGWEAGVWFGIRPWFEWLETRTYRMHVRVLLARYRTYQRCPACGGTRLKESALQVRLRDLDIAAVSALTIGAARRFFDEIEIPAAERSSLLPVYEEVTSRLRYLEEVGLGYLTLDRQSRTLSGGEMQRVNLTAAVGSRLVGTLFVLDEPSVGLHPRDNDRLLGILRRLVDAGNTAVVVEHEEAVLRAADHLIDLGPGAGERGGEIVVQGDLARVLRQRGSETARVLRKGIDLRRGERGPLWEHGRIEIRAAAAHNLRAIDVDFPRGRLSCVSGVSGSGKSTLVETVLYRNAQRQRGEPISEPGAVGEIRGLEVFERIVHVDANAPLRSGKSTVATALGIWGEVRKIFGSSAQARARGFTPATFSFNTAGGRCEACEGAGVERVEMQFLADVEMPCSECGGRRFRDEVLEVRVGGRSVAEILALSLEEVRAWLPAGAATTCQRIDLAVRTGLGYLRLGQAVAALSGGESQRLKIAVALGRKAPLRHHGRRLRERPHSTLYLFDEPTTGLHGSDIENLFRAFELLLERGHTLIVIEHHLDLIGAADYVVDLGPEGGADGGRVVACGPPEKLRNEPASITGRYLARNAAPRRAGARAAEGRASYGERARQGAAGGAIALSGVRQNNLRDLHLDVPRGKVTVVTGVSGSGKSSLAFDVLYQEGQRRYLDTLSPYARQFIGQVARPAVDRIDGLPAAVAIEQRTTRSGPGSTVATITEIWHGLRLLFTRIGVQHCTGCGRAVQAVSPERIVAEVAAAAARGGLRLFAPLVRGKKGYHREIFEGLVRFGCEFARVDGEILTVLPPPPLDRYVEHDVEALVAELPRGVEPALIAAQVQRALELGAGAIQIEARGTASTLSTHAFCERCGLGFPEPDPRRFSFNSRQGRCPQCLGSGVEEAFDPLLIVVHPELSIAAGAIPTLFEKPFSRNAARRFARQIEDALGFDADRPWRRFGCRQREKILQGTAQFEGLLERLEYFRHRRGGDVLEALRSEQPCRACQGARLGPLSRAVRVAGATLPEVGAMSVLAASRWVRALGRARPQITPLARRVIAEVRRELEPRLGFLRALGLEYLRLDRAGPTLSGGEAQRIRIAASLGSNLCGSLYVLDEPTIGLHPSDHDRLMSTLEKLRERGNTVLIVEHDEETITRAEHVIELGPGAGKWGGRVVFEGPPQALKRESASPTGRALRGRGRGRQNPRPPSGEVPGWIRIRGARRHNLEGVDCRFPMGAMTVFTGVSGSGKTTLVREILLESLRSGRAVGCEGVAADLEIESVREVDQSPIGRTPRSVPATYVDVFGEVRKLFAATALARERGWAPGRFSFNVRGGRCEVCKGRGERRIEMSFLPVARVPCSACHGRRFHAETLEVRYGGLSIADVLELTVEQALEVFRNHRRIRAYLQVLYDVGLGYLHLGQQSPTLSGGEGQRLKLAQELGKRPRGHSVYILDEPTTGLSISDCRRLIGVLHRMVARGDTLLVIEHNPEVIGEADYLVDLGPGGGDQGGEVVLAGWLEPLLESRRRSRSRTLAALRPWWERFARRSRLAGASDGARRDPP